MPTFRYQALNAEQQLVVGQLQADGVGQAIAQLEAAGLAVQSIGFAAAESSADEPPRVVGVAIDATRRPGPVPDANVERAALQTHMTRVITQSQAIVPALRAFADEMPPGRRRRELLAVCRILDQGDATAAATALAVLPEYWIPLLSAASSSSDPGRILREFLDESQRADELRRQWRLTLAYPAIVAAIALLVLLGFAAFVAPQFYEIFQDFNLSLPGLTIFIINASRWIVSPEGLLTIGVVAAVVAILVVGPRLFPESFGAWVNDRLGNLFGRSTAIAQFSRFLADLLDAGMDAPSALRIAGFTSRRPRLRAAGWSLARDLDAGAAAPPRRDQHPLTATLVYALRSDIPTASRVHLLKELSSSYADRVRNRLSWTQGVIQPIAIAAIGAIVGLVVIALFLPLVDLINNLSG